MFFFFCLGVVGVVLCVDGRQRLLCIRDRDVAALFWKTGVCGGFTTFSTFSLEAFSLLENGNRGLGALYILLSILLCLGGIALGQAAAGALLKTAAT